MPIKDREESRAYQNKWYQDNKEEHDRRLRLKRSVMRRIVQELKLDPCTDCGKVYHHVAMDFDHLPGTSKLFEVSDVRKISSVYKLMEELDKCELVCSNCHRVRTYCRAYPGGIDGKEEEG